MPKLTSSDIAPILKETVDSFPHPACETCECFLGLVAQLRVDAEPGAQGLFSAHKVERGQIHACLGCDPCPPGEKYAAYQRGKQHPGLITL